MSENNENLEHLLCSFCGESQNNVSRLIASPNKIFICDSCVKKCNENLEAFLEVEKVVKKVRPQSVKTGCGRGVLLTGGGQGPRLRSKYTYIRTHIHRTNTHSNVTRMTERAT